MTRCASSTLTGCPEADGAGVTSAAVSAALDVPAGVAEPDGGAKLGGTVGPDAEPCVVVGALLPRNVTARISSTSTPTPAATTRPITLAAVEPDDGGGTHPGGG